MKLSQVLVKRAVSAFTLGVSVIAVGVRVFTVPAADAAVRGNNLCWMEILHLVGHSVGSMGFYCFGQFFVVYRCLFHCFSFWDGNKVFQTLEGSAKCSENM